MSLHSQTELTRGESTTSLLWNNGGVDVSTSNLARTTGDGEFVVDQNPFDTDRACAEVQVIFDYAQNGIASMLSLVPFALNILADMKTNENFDFRRHSAMQVDMFVEQIGQIAQDSEIGGVNMLHSLASRLTIPFFVTDIVIEDERHQIETLGLSVSVVRETVGNGSGDKFIGLYVASTSMQTPILWMNSLALLIENNGEEMKSDGSFLTEIDLLEEQLLQFRQQLLLLESQFESYIKRVSEVITDPVK